VVCILSGPDVRHCLPATRVKPSRRFVRRHGWLNPTQQLLKLLPHHPALARQPQQHTPRVSQTITGCPMTSTVVIPVQCCVNDGVNFKLADSSLRKARTIELFDHFVSAIAVIRAVSFWIIGASLITTRLAIHGPLVHWRCAARSLDKQRRRRASRFIRC